MNFSEKSKETLVNRRDFLKIAGGIIGGLLLPGFNLSKDKAESSELKETLDWENGVEALLKDVYESPVETSGVFVETIEGNQQWINIEDLEKRQGAIYPKKITEQLNSRDLKGKIKKVISLHTHPLQSFYAIEKKSKDIIEKFKTGEFQEGLCLPPSDADMDLCLSMKGSREKEWERVFTKDGLDHSLVQHGVVEPAGVWVYSSIKKEELPENSPLKTYLKNKESSEKDWLSLWNNKLENKSRSTSTGELRSLLIQHASDRIKNYLQKSKTDDLEMLMLFFKGALSYSEDLIKAFVDQEDLPVALAHQKNWQQTYEINNNFKKAFTNIFAKSLKGKTTQKDRDSAIKAVKWKQVDLSFTPHSKELIEKIQSKQ